MSHLISLSVGQTKLVGCNSSLYNYSLLFCAVSLIGLATGCNNSPYEMANVQGTVTINGEPMTQGKVMFAPMAEQGELNPGKAAFGSIDSTGQFQLSTYGDLDGAVVGKHSVTLINIPAATSPAKGSPVFTRVLVPGKFDVVSGDTNEIKVELDSAHIKKYGSL